MALEGMPSDQLKDGQRYGWSQSGRLKAVGILAGRERKVSMQADFPEPGPYSVQFTIQGPGGINIPNPIAYVNWKVQGNQASRLMSVVDGATISGVGEAVKVDVYDESEAINGFDYDVTIQCTRGTRASNSIPPTYNPIGFTSQPGRFFVPAGLTRTIDIPQNAGLSSLYITAAAQPVAVLTEADLSARLINTIGTLKEWDPRFSGWVPISPTSQQLVLDNNSAGGILFGVSFGVDG